MTGILANGLDEPLRISENRKYGYARNHMPSLQEGIQG